MTDPSLLNLATHKISTLIPDEVKVFGKTAGEMITDAEIFKEALKILGEAFKFVEEQAARFSIKKESVLAKVNTISLDNEITEIEEICLLRSYRLAKLVNSQKLQNELIAFLEGGTTGYFGFAGLPFNLIFSSFLCFRAVQTVAMFYGYDVKNDPDELAHAGEVFTRSLNPGQKQHTGVGGMMSKIILMSEVTTVRQLTKKTWTDFAARGGVSLLIVQMRALANNSAKKALEKAGRKELEQSIFTNAFTQFGKHLSKKSVAKMAPLFSAGIGAAIDMGQVRKVIEFANIYYHQRFLTEKEIRISNLLDEAQSVIKSDCTSLED